MKTHRLIIAITLALVACGSAQQKVSERAELSSGSLDPTTDILPIVDISAGTAGSKKITINNLFTGWGFTAAGASMAKAADASAQRTLLGITGNIYNLSYGTSNGNLVRLDATTGKLPAVDGSLLTNLPSTFSTSSGLRGILSDETGTGAAVFATSPSISSPTLTTPTITLGSDATGDIYYRNSGGNFTRLPIGTTGYVLTVASGLPSWAAASGGGGLTNWTDAISTSSPNGTVPAASLTATNAASNVDAVLKPKGSGSIIAHIPDSSATGGDKRGSYSTDWQRDRLNASEVASGSYAVLAGGSSNTAGGDFSVIGGGSINSASGTNSVVSGGYVNQATANYSTVSGGEQNQATATDAAALGGKQNTASGTAAVVAGSNNTADGSYSAILGGRRATTRGLFGMTAHSVGLFADPGDAQSGHYKLMAETSDATQTELTLGNQTAGSTTRIVLGDNFTYSFRGQAVALSSGGDSKAWQFSGVIERRTGEANTAIIGSVTSSNNADGGASSWALTIDADTTNGSLRVRGTGAASTSIRWIVSIDTLELGY